MCKYNHGDNETVYKDEVFRTLYVIDSKHLTFGAAIIYLMENKKLASFDAWEYLHEMEHAANNKEN